MGNSFIPEMEYQCPKTYFDLSEYADDDQEGTRKKQSNSSMQAKKNPYYTNREHLEQHNLVHAHS